MQTWLANFVLSDERRHIILRHITFWVVSWIFQGIIYGFHNVHLDIPQGMKISFVNAAIFLPQHMLLTYGMIYFIFPRYIFKGHYLFGVLGVLALLSFTALLSPFISIYIINEIWSKEVSGINSPLLYGFMAGLRGSMSISGFAAAIKLIKQWYLKKEESIQLEKAKLLAELDALKGQIHPHFMFNTLNSIYMMALKQSDKTAETILRLSELMRYMVSDSSQMAIPMEQEVKTMQNYIALEKNRFGERLDMSVNINGDFSDKKIIPVIFLPFLENSFKYGTSEMLDQAWISLDLSVQNEKLKLKLMNSKRSDYKTPNGYSTHFGLSYVKKRLDFFYPKAHDLRITEDEDIFVVNLSMNLDGLRIPEGG
jgi:sensor histidine kinase YesM